MKKIIALWIIAMIIALPIYSASAIAGLSNVRAHGYLNPETNSCLESEDGAEYVIIEADAAVEGDTDVTASQLRLKRLDVSGPEFAFNVKEGTSHFKYDFSGNHREHSADEEFQYGVALYDDGGNLVDSASLFVEVDDGAPILADSFHIERLGAVIDSTTITPATTGITFNYAFIDSCAGVYSVNYYVNGVSKGAVPTEPISANDLKPGTAWPTNGVLNICLVATDNFGHSSRFGTNCQTIKIDAEAPVFSNLRVNGEPSFLTNGIEQVKVSVDAYDASGLMGNALANFAQLNSALSSYAAGKCTTADGINYRCEWDVQLALSGEGPKAILFSATDNLGNAVNGYSMNIGYVLDKTPPVITLRTNHAYNGEFFVKGSSNKFNATIVDASGVTKTKVKLDVSDLINQLSVRDAESCNAVANAANTYDCVWSIPETVSTGDSKEVSVTATDNAGNSASASITVTVDRIAPELFEQDALEDEIKVEERGKPGNIILIPDYAPIDGALVGTTPLRAVAIVKDDYGIRAYADFSRVAADGFKGWKSSFCTPTVLAGEAGNFWRCEWSYEDVGGDVLSLEEKRPITFKFEDAAGNSIERNVEVEITRADIILDRIEIKSKNYDNIVSGNVEYVVGKTPLDVRAYLRSATGSISAIAEFGTGLELRDGGTNRIAADECVLDETTGLVVCSWDSEDYDSGTLPREGSFAAMFEFRDPNGNMLPVQRTIRLKTPKLAIINITISQPDISSIFGGQELPKSLGEPNTYLVNGYLASITARMGHTEAAEINAQVSANADLSGIVPAALAAEWSNLDTDCTFVSNYWKCEWKSIPVNATRNSVLPEKVKTYFVFEDVLQNRYPENATGKYEKEIDMLTVANVLKDYWVIRQEDVRTLPPDVDRQTAQIFSQRVYFLTPLTLKSGFSSDNVKTVQISKTEACKGWKAGTGNSLDYVAGGANGIKIMNTNPESREPWFYLDLNKQEMTVDNLKINCSLTIISKEGQFISLPERENVTLEVDFYNMPIGEIGANINAKIDSVRNDVMFKLSETLKFLEDIIKLAEDICRFVQLIKELDNLIAAAMNILDILRPLPGGNEAANLGQHSSKLVSKFGDKIFKHLDKFCAYISCDEGLWGMPVKDWKKSIEDSTPSSLKFIYGCQESERTTGEGKDAITRKQCLSAEVPFSPKDSLILSMATGCIPGIVYNLRKWRQIECSYVYCLRYGIVDGVPVSVCEQERSYLKCKYVFGEIFNLIPFAHFFKYVGNIVQTLLHDPVSLIFGGAVFYCEQMHPTNFMSYVCILAKNIPELAKIADDLVRFAENKRWDLDADMCDAAFEGLDGGESSEESEESEPTETETG